MAEIEFSGRLNSIVFENEQDLFKILDVDILSPISGFDREDIRVTGNFGDLQVGASYHFNGELITHPKFGQQFKAYSYSQVLPHEESSLIKYLSSDRFPGIGKKAAEKIITELGTDALDAIKKNPNEIQKLSLTAKQKDVLLQGVNQMDSFSDVVLKLARYGIRKKVAANIYKAYHADAIKKLEDDPYALVGEIRGFGFKTADTIGREIGIEESDIRRLQGAICQVLESALAQEGDTYVKLADLLTQASKLLSLEQFDALANAVNNLQEKGKVVVDGENAALTNIFNLENDIARDLKRLVKTRPSVEKFSDKEITTAIAKAEKSLKITYDDTQKEAIKNALNNPISILTGGPGTGKTTIINGILLCLQQLEDIPTASLYSDDPPFLLAAPTGRAAKRMGEVSNISAKTIHRMLGLGIGESSDVGDLNELNGDILIVDEMSMVDMFLFKMLIKSIDTTKHIVFVGDQDQLPSVGAGNVFSDLIASGAFPTTRLKVIHRQGDDSSIISLAHAINENRAEQVIFSKTKNYSFIPCPSNQIAPAIEQIVNLALKKGFEKDDIQVLGAMYHGNGGINNLNDILQNIMNPKKPEAKKIEAHNEVFKIGDRILQLQNNPEKDIYNGQIGKVIGIDENNKSECFIANFDDREIKFGLKDLTDLTRAYAITIHKSQGSEFPLVILNLTMQNYMMLRKNLLYTAITRAEKNLVMVGEKRAYEMALSTSGNDRKTDLTRKIRIQLDIKPAKKLTSVVSSQIQEDKEKPSEIEQEVHQNEQTSLNLEEAIDPEEMILTPQLIYSGKIDPMIGMENVKLGIHKPK
ncbi:ATP-dependent RecD-like DNA helicase [uncultured Lactobacillus sp.]|uniref:SF1B family DNA helicase RecD2 n=1 Tax=uncultured Lactobacillus sp. TaxID=153152 RepID=UPI0026339EE9|nr:ATP-dependent RecD-like DNA helicase [uncultured Lactobacillus sp.]